MPSIKLDLMWTIFAVFCFYSLYTPFVSFMWDEKGRHVFRNLRIPLVVFIYFLVPCIALLLLNIAFRGIQQPTWTYMISAGLILILSFVVMLYILTVPNWPIGRFLQIHMVPVSIIRITVSVNVAVSLVVAVISVTIIRGTPGAIQTQGQESTFQRLELTKDKLDEQRTSSIESISDLRVEAVKKVIDDYISTANGILTLVVGLCSLVASMRVLDTRKGTAEMKDGDHQK